ncbi:hypothetical protein OF83DRAFT_1148726 [Amylostereum chailletii]|nr:hypothetical protein OF83DRAFT_1148726 [Amylostereum chailletii]
MVSLNTFFPELLYMVLDEIQARDDLLSLASTCSAFKALIVPNRLEYHTISTSVYYPALWNHLISRPYLARNIRELVLCDDYTSESTNAPRWRLPRVLGRPGSPSTSGKIGDVNRKELAAALRLMALVSKVDIRLTRGVETSGQDNVALVISNLPSLVDLKLVVSDLAILNNAGGGTFVSRDPAYPLWKLSHLRSINLDFNVWDDDLWPPFLAVLLRSSDIEELHVPQFVTCNFSAFAAFRKCRFPSLKRLYISPSIYPSFDEDVFLFLKAHPGIEILSWSAYGACYTVPCAILPSLKRLLNCNPATVSGLIHNNPDASVPLESIEDLDLDPVILPAFDRINPATFRRLSMQFLDSFATLRMLSVRFPALVEIELPRRGPWDDNRRVFMQLKKALLRPWFNDLAMPHIDDVLVLFPRAEVVKGVRCTGLSYGQNREHPKVVQVLTALKARYPRLRRVNTWRLC